MAEPSPLFVQFPQVVSPPAVEKRPCGSEPVRISCMLTASPRPLTISPFSVMAVCLVILFESEWRSSTLFAMRSDDRCAFVALVAKPVSRAPRPRATGQADQKLLKSQYIGPSDPGESFRC